MPEFTPPLVKDNEGHVLAVSDDEVSRIIDEDSITEARRKAESKFTSMDSDTYYYMRQRAKTDLFFLASGILQYNRLSINLHGNLCSWMDRHKDDSQFKIVLLPRGHFKSTVVTISDSIQICLPDDTKTEPWPRNLGPDCRLLLAHETQEGSSRFLYSIASHWLSNPVLMGLFPEAIPSPKKQRINKFLLELPRTSFWSEPTFDTMGVGGKSQGRHYNYLKLDDLIGDKARDSVTEMQTAKDWFDNVQSFFSTFKKDRWDMSGTRWAFDDLYSHVFDRYESQVLRYIRGVEEVQDGILQPIFPEEFSTKSLDILRKNVKVFSAQYANDPSVGATEFDKSWKRYYEWLDPSKMRLAVLSDGNSASAINTRQLDTCILIDPAVTGLSGTVVTGTDFMNRVFTLEAIKDSFRTPDFIDLIFRLVQRWQPRIVAIEEVLFSALYKPFLEREMQIRNVRFYIEPVKTGGKAKDARVRGLGSYFSAGMIYFHKSQTDLIREYDNFGATDNYHMLDALAYGPFIWRKGLAHDQMERNEQAVKEMMNVRNAETGYSDIDY